MKAKHVVAGVLGVGLVAGIIVSAIFMPEVAIALAVIGFIGLGITFAIRGATRPSRHTTRVIATATPVHTTTTTTSTGIFGPTVTQQHTTTMAPSVTVVRKRENPDLAVAGACFKAAGWILGAALASKSGNNTPSCKPSHHGHHDRGVTKSVTVTTTYNNRRRHGHRC